MNKNVLAAASLAVLVAEGTAQAQTAGTTPPAPTQLAATSARTGTGPEEIIVTASKRAEKLLKVPMSITAISGTELKEKGINNVQDLARVTPGLSYAESGLSTPVYSLRGVGFYDTSIGARPTVSVYLDEAPLPFSIMSEGTGFDLARVEVLKGPQGTLFGSNATGGAINYIAAKPQSNFGAGITASYASFNTADIQGYVTGPLTDNLNARLAFHTIQGGGWQQSYTRDATNGNQDMNEGRFMLDWTPSDRFRVSLNVNGFYDHSDTQAAQLIGVLYITPGLAGNVPLIGTYPLSPHNDRAADWDPNTDFAKDNHFFQSNLRAEYDLTSDIQLTSLTSYSEMDINQLNDVDGLAITSSNIRVTGRLSSVSEELRLSGTRDNLKWILGGNYSYDTSVENDHIYFPYASANYVFDPSEDYDETHPYIRQSFSTPAVFGNVDYTIGDFVLHGGIRYTEADLTYQGCTKVDNNSSGAAITSLFNILRSAYHLPPIPNLTAGQCQSLDETLTPNIRNGTLDQSNVSWRTGVDYKLSADILLYANISRGYKGGSAPAPGAINLEEFNPVTQESVLAYEAGFKAVLAHHFAEVSGAGFYYDYTNKQLLARAITTPNLLGALPALVNVPKTSITGAEGQITLYPVNGLNVTGAFTYLDSVVNSNFPNYDILGNLDNFKGEPFPYTPKWQFVFDGEYKFPLSEKFNAMIGATLNYRTKTSAGFGTSPYLDIGSYALLDLRAGVQDASGKWSIEAFGRNVTDSYYWTDVAKFNDTVRRYAGMPAVFGIQVSDRF